MSYRVAVAIAALVFHGVALAEESISLSAVDRLGRPVAASACVVQKDSCPVVPLGSIKVVGSDLSLRVSAPGFETKEVRLVPGPHTVSLKSKNSLSATFAANEKGQEWSAEISLAADQKGQKGKALEVQQVLLPKAPESKTVTFEDVPAGDYWLSWEGPQIAAEASRLTAKENGSTSAGKIDVRGGLVVRGFVREPSGAPVPDAEIRFSDPARMGPLQAGWKAKSSPTGEFSIAGLPITKLSWFARATGYAGARGDWSSEPSLEITMAKAQRIQGRVVDDKKEPLGEAKIAVVFQTKTFKRGGAPVTAKDDGSFLVYREATGDVVLNIRVKGFLPREVEITKGPEEDVLDLGELALSRGRTLKGKVIDAATSLAVPDAVVQLAELNSDVRTTTDAEGHFSLETVPEKDVEVLASASGYAKKRVSATRETTDISIPLGRGGTLKARVCGTPAELWEIALMLQTVNNPPILQNTGPNGSGEFAFTNVGAGEYFLGVRWKLGVAGGSQMEFASSPAKKLTITEGQTTVVSFRCDGLPIGGSIRSPGQALPPVYGVVKDESGTWLVDFRADESGRFITKVPKSGRYSLEVSFPAAFKAAPSEFCMVPEGGKTDCVFTVTGQ